MRTHELFPINAHARVVSYQCARTSCFLDTERLMMHSKGSSIPYDLSYTIVSLVYVLIKCTREKKPFYNNHHRIRNRKQLCHVETIVHARMTSLIVQMDCLHDNILSQDSRCVYTYFSNGMSPPSSPTHFLSSSQL